MPPWSWSYGRCIYLFNQCLSTLPLWIRIPLRLGGLDIALCDKVGQRLGAGFNNISVIWWSIFSFSGHLNIPSLINYMMVGLWCLTPLSTIVQLYRGGQFYRCRKPKYTAIKSFLYYISTGCRRGRDRMVDVFTYSISVYQHYRCEFEFRSG
jgi:hypothetical protein